jgi:hypothetical protein
MICGCMYDSCRKGKRPQAIVSISIAERERNDAARIGKRIESRHVFFLIQYISYLLASVTSGPTHRLFAMQG